MDLDEPLRVDGVRPGKVRDIYSGAYPSFVRPEDGRAWQETLAKDAWRVDLVGRMAFEHPQCPNVPILDATAQLILDRQTGEVLLSVYGQPPCPADRT